MENFRYKHFISWHDTEFPIAWWNLPPSWIGMKSRQIPLCHPGNEPSLYLGSPHCAWSPSTSHLAAVSVITLIVVVLQCSCSRNRNFTWQWLRSTTVVMLAIQKCQWEAITSFLGVRRCVCIGGNSIYGARCYPALQTSTGGLVMYPPWIGEDCCTETA